MYRRRDVERETNERTNRWMKGCTIGADVMMGGWADVLMGGCVDGWMGGWADGRMVC